MNEYQRVLDLTLCEVDIKEQWITEANDLVFAEIGLPCFRHFKPQIKPDFPYIEYIHHLGTCTDDKFRCILEFTDGRLQEMPPHPPGQCEWCEYKYFEEEGL